GYIFVKLSVNTLYSSHFQQKWHWTKPINNMS
ncbi:hypothetical protein D046_0859B, partial [Vibrio parahaemolyticus V-223/04]